ncbi:MAG: alpha/beta hydrolase [Gammaproteobacteria bacterium]|nr:alpha/beta hydrolase [Gammaproteobacteria bacterium]
MNWLLLRGLGREQRHWGDFPALLQQRSGGQVVCLDLPGTGSEHHRLAPATVPANVDDLRRRWCSIARAGDDWTIVGLSLGGMLALHWLDQYPQDFIAGTIINSSAATLSPSRQRLQPRAKLKLIRAILTSAPYPREQQILALTSNRHADRYHIAATWAGYAQDAPLSGRNLLRQLYAAARFRPPAQLTRPLLVLCSSADRLVNCNCSAAIARFYRADFKRHQLAGHDLPLDDPDWVISHILEFTHNRVRVAREQQPPRPL